MIQVESVEKAYTSRKNTVRVLERVSLEVRPGEVCALLGRNGSGKTTTIRIICGLVLPDAGRVSINGYTLGEPEYMAQFGALIDTNRGLYPRLSPLENLQYTCMVRGMSRQAAVERAKHLLEELGLWDKRNAPTQTLSKGMLSKLAFANAIAHDPPFVLLDEPTLGLDIDAAEALEAQIRQMAQSGKGILLTTHQMEVAERLASRVAILSKGRIAVDRPKSELMAMFARQTYRVVLAEPLLEDILPMAHSLDETRTVLEVSLEHPRQIYELMDKLRPAPIKHIERLEADLGEIFKTLTKEPHHV
ncbi:ABC transporter ATP-binding protein NatA [Meiothermus luteus]|jgi:ABC-2 type transport system ATP-binding protein|uniref:ABC transporter ATP-binding protein NatA n=1 Tax=Meiothermus luteus TaxID=2026184 RepID=A0A399EU72_9DEIN|nr:ABC transporter ATP-binding protein NatA [Meiothermus luteus]RMH58132.1 MAG: ATP-binding cassette domain-containing protein [Deinococcota bacterium]